jgi:putative oxidoreductase
MPTDLPSTLFFLARVLLGGAFVVFGLRNFLNFQKLRPGMAAKGVPLPDVALTIGLLLQTLGGALVLFGLLTPWGAAAIILFLILATMMYHPFWAFAGEERTTHLHPFITNCALSGGALALMATSI